MISPLELCHIVESGFLPAKCKCTIDSDGLMTVQVFDAQKGHADMLASGIPVQALTSSRAIATFVAELKEQLRLRAKGRSVGAIGKQA